MSDTRSADQLAKLGWTSVTDRLPKWTEDSTLYVLVYSATHDWGGARYAIMRQLDFCHYDPDDDEPGTHDSKVVTHWMSLPQEPRS